MIKKGAILMAFLAIASSAKAADVIYTGSRDIKVDLSVLGTEEDIKLKPDEVLLTEPKTAAKPKDVKPEKIILKKPPFTYKKVMHRKADKKADKKPEVSPAHSPILPKRHRPAAVKPAPAPKPALAPVPKMKAKKRPIPQRETKAEAKNLPEPVVASVPTPEAKPALKSAPVPVPAVKPAIKDSPVFADAPAPLAAPVTEVEKNDIGDIITKSGHVIFFNFAPSATGLTAKNKEDLKEVANTVKADNRLAIRLISYAKNPELSSSKARRTSLSRALTIRDFLLKQGIPSSKIEVHALGNRVQKDQVFLEILAEE